ncbi:hypothetical protein JOS77_07335 [Chromobacterium haemolyticum]|nr:hypothetical protein JOS77_07335 [Chromobacterium haemolyticum]
MIFIKPTIVRDDLGARSIATDRYNYIIGEGHKAEKEKLQMNLDSALKSLPESGIRSTLEQSLKAQPK